MTILEYYLNKQKDFSWRNKFQSTSNSQAGKTFPYINTNFRGITAFFNQLASFESKDGIRRSDWGDYQATGQEKDKHRVINLINAGFLTQNYDIYRITDRGKAVLALWRSTNIAEYEKWPLLLLLLLEYKTEPRGLDVLYAVMKFYSAMKDVGIPADTLLRYLKKGNTLQR